MAERSGILPDQYAPRLVVAEASGVRSARCLPGRILGRVNDQDAPVGVGPRADSTTQYQRRRGYRPLPS